MELKKITEADLQGVGVIGMEDTPNLSALEMQKKVEEVVREVVIPAINANVDATASKEDLRQAVFNSGAGDMQAQGYDNDMDGVVNRADNGFFNYTHSKSGNVHYLTGKGENIKFVSSAAFAEGDVFMIDGSICPAFLVNGESLPDGFFKEDMAVFCFRHGNCLNFSSGGAGGVLNFKVIGSTVQPASPAENTIWVNTDIKITGWAFAPQQPDYLSAGGIWFPTGTSGQAEFNAVKNNTLAVFPLSAQQWDGSSYVEKPVYIYKNGAWTSFAQTVLYVYNQGNSDTGFAPVSLVNGYKNEDGVYDGITCRELHTHIQIGCTQAIRSLEKIDLTGYRTLKAVVMALEGYGDADRGVPNITMFVTDEPNQTLNNEDSGYSSIIGTYRRNEKFSTWTEFNYSIKDISGKHYVGIGNGNFTVGASQLYVKALWLE